MTTLEIRLDEATAEAIRQQARQAGKTPEAWASEVIAQQAAAGGSAAWVKDFLAATERPKGDSGGWKWNREEIYDE